MNPARVKRAAQIWAAVVGCVCVRECAGGPAQAGAKAKRGRRSRRIYILFYLLYYIILYIIIYIYLLFIYLLCDYWLCGFGWCLVPGGVCACMVWGLELGASVRPWRGSCFVLRCAPNAAL